MRSSLPTAVIGGGPAGAFCAAQLASSRPVVLLDEKLAWEKPCGGGVTDKALREFPVLREAVGRANPVTECELFSPAGRSFRLTLDAPIAIFSRHELNQFFLDQAAAAGVEVVRERVVALAPAPEGWRLALRGGRTLLAAAVVVAAGARNALHPGTAPPAADAMATVGYYIPVERLPWPAHRMLIWFLPGLEGYAWSFPRRDHASVGICGKSGAEPVSSLRRRLESLLDQRAVAWRGSPLYAHLLPAPTASSLVGEAWEGGGPHRWACIGDAAGLVDPITGEGIYYALRSAQLLAQAWSHPGSPRYSQLLEQHLLPELRAALRIAPRFYHGTFLAAPVLERMVQFGCRSGRFRCLLADLFCGRQGYLDLGRQLYRNLLPTLAELAASRV